MATADPTYDPPFLQGDSHAFRQPDRWFIPGGATGAVAPTLASTNFDTFLLALPEWFPNSGVITDLGFYLSGDATAKGWIGVFTNTRDSSGNFFPGTRLASFESIPGSADGHLFRSGSVTAPVAGGCLLWFVMQLSATTAAAAFSFSFGNSLIGGWMPPATASTSNIPRKCGWRTSAAVTYDSSLSTFPTAGVVLADGNAADTAPLLIGGGSTSLMPIPFFKFRQ